MENKMHQRLIITCLSFTDIEEIFNANDRIQKFVIFMSHLENKQQLCIIKRKKLVSVSREKYQ